MKGDLYINGLKIENWEQVSGLGENEDDLTLNVKDYVLIDKKATEKFVLEIDQHDADVMESLLRCDADKFTGKKVKFIVQILGPVQKR